MQFKFAKLIKIIEFYTNFTSEIKERKVVTTADEKYVSTSSCPRLYTAALDETVFFK